MKTMHRIPNTFLNRMQQLDQIDRIDSNLFETTLKKIDEIILSAMHQARDTVESRLTDEPKRGEERTIEESLKRVKDGVSARAIGRDIKRMLHDDDDTEDEEEPKRVQKWAKDERDRAYRAALKSQQPNTGPTRPVEWGG